jgi:hypothetical protein
MITPVIVRARERNEARIIMRRFSFHAVIIGGFALLTIVLTYPLILHLTTHIPVHKDWHPSGSEHWTSMWAIWFVAKRIMESHQWSLFTDTIFYPRGVDLTNTTFFGFGLTVGVAIPFVWYLGIILTFNLLIIGSFILTAYSTFLLVRYLTGDSRAAFVSGFIFAFSPFQMARVVSMFGIVTSGMWIPFYVLFFIKAIRGGLTFDLVLAPLVLILTLISNPYYAIFLGMFSVIYSFYYPLSNKSLILCRILLRRLFFMGCLTVLFFLPLAWVLLTHWSKDFQVDIRLSPEFGADLMAFFIPSIHHSLWGDSVKSIYYTHFTGNPVEQTVYIGYIVLLLSSIALIKTSEKETHIWSLLSVIFFVLSLGPFLHINGESSLKVDGISIMLPLPSYLLHFLPVLSAMRASSRFSIMLMLSLAVIAGYGMRHLLTRLKGRLGVLGLFLGIIGIAICLEFSIVPLPLADARIPRVYETIATEGSKGGTLLDVPLYWFMTKYEYYQTAHLKRLFIGQAPRIPLELIVSYGDTIPFIKFFRNPELINDYERTPVDKGDILRFIEFFDVSFIVIHKAYLGEGLFDHLRHIPNSPSRAAHLRGPEVFDRLMRFLMTYFPVTHVEADGDLVVLTLARAPQADDLWMGQEGPRLDFDATHPQFFLTDGWAPPERWRDLTFAWAAAKESRLWVYLPGGQALAMEVRVQPFTFPGSPPQGMTIEVNGRVVSHIALATSAWQNYTVHLTPTDLVQGINTVRFVYDYTASPAAVLPSNGDRRQLAVNFDYIAFHPE